MRLPEFLTRISPVGETLDSIGVGEENLTALVEAENSRLSVATADAEGLRLWEKDYGLADGTGEPDATRRLQIRTAMAGACTLTPQRLKSLCVTLGGADYGEVEEDFPQWAVRVYPVTEGRLPPGYAALESSIRRLMPAHLSLEVLPCTALTSANEIFGVATGGLYAELWGCAPQPVQANY